MLNVVRPVRVVELHGPNMVVELDDQELFDELESPDVSPSSDAGTLPDD